MNVISSVGVVVTGVVTIAVVAAVAVLTWHGSITGEAAITLFSAVLAGGGAAAIGHTATKTGARATARDLGAPAASRRSR